MNTSSARLIVVFGCLALGIWPVIASDNTERESPGVTEIAALTGILTIGTTHYVWIELDGESFVVRKTGQEFAAYKVRHIDLIAPYVELEKDGTVIKATMKAGVIKEGDSRDAAERQLVAEVRRKLVVVGCVLSSEQLDKFAQAKVDGALRNTSLPADLRARLLDSLLNQERLLVVGPEGISEADRVSLGISEVEAQQTNAMREFGPSLKSLQQGNDPVVVEAE